MSRQNVKQQQTTYVTQGYVINVPSNAGAEKYAKTFLTLGWIQFVLSFLSVTVGITVLVYASINSSNYDYNGYYYDSYAFIGTGIWCGVYFFTSGLFGVLSGKKKTRKLVIASLVMSILSALAAVSLFSLEIIGAMYAANYSDDYYWSYNREAFRVSCGFHSFLCVVAAIEFVVSIVHSAYCCGAQCGQSATTTTAPRTTYGYVNPMGGQVTALPGPPAAYVQGPSVPFSVQPYQQPSIMTSVVAQPPINYQIQPVQQAYMVPHLQLQPQQQQTGQTLPPNYQEQNAIKA